MTLFFTVSETNAYPLWDYGWLDLTRFKIEGSPIDRINTSQVLQEFLRDPISQRSFCTQGPWGESIQRHGPFLHEKLLADWFQQISQHELADRVQAALDDPDFSESPSHEQRVPVEAWIEKVKLRGDTAFVLVAPDETDARVEWHFVWTIYHEFACLSPDREELTLGVIGFD